MSTVCGRPVSLGGGGAKLNILYGADAAPPAEKVGVYAQVTQPISQTMITAPVAVAGEWRSDFATATADGGYNVSNAYILKTDGIDFYLSDSYGGMRRYSTSTNTWTVLAAPPLKCNNSALIAWGGKIYKLGGYNSGDNGDSYYSSVYLYTPETNTWVALPNMASGVAALFVDTYNNVIYLAGNDGGYASRKIIAYDPATNTSSLVFAKNDRYQQFSSLVAFSMVGKYLYSYGGLRNGTAASENYQFHKFDVTNGNDTSLYSKAVYNSSGPVGFSMGSYLYYLVGGVVRRFDAANEPTASWEALANAPAAVQRTSAIVVGNTAYVFFVGGASTGSMQYKLSGDSYPAGTLVVEIGMSGNMATVLSDKEARVDLDVKSVSYHDGISLKAVPAKVKSINGAWKEVL